MKNKNYTHLFKDNIWGADLADMPLISKFNKGFRFLLFVIDIYSKYAWVIPVKASRGTTITNAFQTLLDESSSKPNKVFVDRGSKFSNRLMKSWLQDNDIEMYSTHNEGKLYIAEKFIRTLRTVFTNIWLQYQKLCIKWIKWYS